MENMEHNTSENVVAKSSFTDEVKDFYTSDFKNLFLTFFTKPIDGIQTIFQNPSAKSYSHALILYISVAILYVLGAVMLAGDMRNYMTVSSYIQVAFFPVFTMLAITVLSFAVKSVSGKIIFKDELLTGALCGIPLGLLIPGMLVAKLLGTDNVLTLLMNPTSGGLIVVLLFLYVFLMLINVFQQSLKSAKSNDTLAWYLSPLCISVAIYLASKISSNLF